MSEGHKIHPFSIDTNTKQMPYYLRFDLGMKYRRNNPRYSWIISLDIQNLTNRQNVVSYESLIDPNNKIIPNPETGIGIIPVLNLKVEF
jgi:outer membrane receptor protein involved in Fe transport